MSPEHTRERAEAIFKRKEKRRIEGDKAMAEYEARQQALREKTARLRALRLAREAMSKKVPEWNSPGRRAVAHHPCEKTEDAAPEGAAVPSSLPPPPIRVLPAPFAMTRAVLAEKHSKTYAGFAVAPLA
jgi:hypothetical protein